MTYTMQEQSGPAAVDTSTFPRLQSVIRVSKIPIVESAWGVAARLYGKVKDSNSMVNWTLSHAEVVSTAALVPAASRLGTPLNAVDSILCKGIDIVEEKVPAIKMPPRQMLDTTREYVVAGLGLNAPGPDAPAAARIIGAGVGAAAVGLRTAVSAMEWCVDKYLPSQQGEDEGSDTEERAVVPVKEGSGAVDAREEAKDTLLRLQRVTRRLHRRLVRIASAQIKTLKQQGEGATTYVGGVAQYITSVVTDPKALVSMVGTAWTEMARQLQDQEGEKDQRYPRVIARRFARRVVGALDNARVTISALPTDVFSRVNSTVNFGISIIGGLLGGSSKKGEDSTSSGPDSEERAKLLCMRQEKGTSPPPAAVSTTSPVTTADKESSTDDKTKASAVPAEEKVSESIAVAN